MSLYSEKDLEFASAVNVEYHGEAPTLVRLKDPETGKFDGEKTEVNKGDVLSVHPDQARQLVRQYGHLFTLEGDTPIKQPDRRGKKAAKEAKEAALYDESGNRLFTEEEVRELSATQVKAALKGWDKKFNRHASVGELQDLLIEHIAGAEAVGTAEEDEEGTDDVADEAPEGTEESPTDLSDEAIEAMSVADLKQALTDLFPDVEFKAKATSAELKALLTEARDQAAETAEEVDEA